MRTIVILIGLLGSANFVMAASPAVDAIHASGAKNSDSLHTKFALLLHLLNDSQYLFESSPDPQRKYATFHATAKEEARQLIEKFSKDSSGAPFAPYDLDSARTPQEMLRQRIGGTCGTHARVLAELAKHLGIADDNLRIVSAVRDEDYRGICPNGRGSPLNSEFNGASGHVFVLVKAQKSWKLINSTYSPFDQKSGPHLESALAARRLLQSRITSKKMGAEAQAKAQDLMRKLAFEDLAAVDFLSPSELTLKLAQGEAVAVPAFEGLSQLGPMTIFEVSRPDHYALHRWQERFHLIASGSKRGTICRFTLPGTEAGH